MTAALADGYGTGRTEYLISCLPTAVNHLRAVGAFVDPFLASLTVWDGEPVEGGLVATELLCFQSVHVAACELLGFSPQAPDLRPLSKRSLDERRHLAHAYRWAAKAAYLHADLLDGSDGALQ